MAARDRQPTERPAADRTATIMVLITSVLIVGSIIGTVIARNRWWLPPVASQHGVDVDRLFSVTFVLIGIAFILVQGALIVFMWRFREAAQERASHWHDNRALEATYTIIPAVVLVGLTVAAAGLWSRIHAAPPADALVVEVRAEQFAWRMRYPGRDGAFGKIDVAQFNLRTNPMALDRQDPAGRDDVVAGELHLVVGRPADIRLRSKDVLHSFFVPAFRAKQDAVPGITITTWFVPTQAGSYEIACAELCGAAHFAMRGKVVVQTQSEFDAWLAAQPRP